MEVFYLKKIKKLAYIILIAIIVILSLTIYTEATKNNNENQQEKSYSEIKYLESKLVNLLNSINNIEGSNYEVSVSKIIQDTGSDSSSSSSGGTEGLGGESGGNSSGSGGESSGGQNSSGNGGEQGTGKSAEKFELKQEGILTSSENINWDNIKGEIEILYETIPTITLDLYQLNTNKEDILNFNKEFDNLTVVVKDEKKEETLAQLSKLYEYIPKFTQNVTNEEIDKVLFETKSNIFKAYSKLDSEDWNGISTDIDSAISSFSKLLTNTNIDVNKQYHISKAYIMINELQNAVNVKDRAIFLIKYKNMIEEFNNI